LDEPRYILEDGTRVRTHAVLDDDTQGMIIAARHLEARRSNTVGVIAGYVAGHGGDVYWVRHSEGDAVAAYGFMEFELEPEPVKRQGYEWL
jgi:hypothetical protein